MNPRATTTAPEVESLLGVDQVPAAILAAGTLEHVDYADQVSIAAGSPDRAGTGQDQSKVAEQWARAMLGDTPNAIERLIWSGFLRLRLDRTVSPTTVAGWRLAGRGTDWIRLEAKSPLMAANLVVRVADGVAAQTTLIRFRTPAGRRVWSTLKPLHVASTPRMLRAAAQHMAAEEVVPAA